MRPITASRYDVDDQPSYAIDHDLQIKLWGYAVWGERIRDVLDIAAIVSERSAILDADHAWDRTADSVWRERNYRGSWVSFPALWTRLHYVVLRQAGLAEGGTLP